MAQEIYNEGRVVGFSAWEIFYREAIANNVPPEDIPDEHQWLTAMIGSGASMILKVPSGTTVGVHDYELPNGSNLTAAGVVIASPFIGDCDWDSNMWAKKVTSYGALIKNNNSGYPSSTNVPTDLPYKDSEYTECVAEFVKITDGIVFTKAAIWNDAVNPLPKKDINPDFNNSSTVVRLYVSAVPEHDVKILLSGFNNKRILQAVSGYSTGNGGGSADLTNNNWKDGGMLGPEIIPWASKIVFSVPSSAFNNTTNSVTRTIPAGASVDSKTVTSGSYSIHLTDLQNEQITTNPLIDFNSINLTEYYTTHSFSGSPTIQNNVSDITAVGDSSYNILYAWYPGVSSSTLNSLTFAKIFPPALYAARVTSTGTQTLVPLDTAAPGTVKCFKDSTQATNYTTVMPDNYAIYHDTVNNSFSFIYGGNTYPVNGKVEYLTAPKVQITAGSTSAKVLAMSNSSNQDYATTGTAGTIQSSDTQSQNLKWDDLLTALTTNKSIDIVGTRLHALSEELTEHPDHNNLHTIGMTTSDNVDYIGARWFMINPDNTKSAAAAPNTWVGTNSVWVTSGVDSTDNTRYVNLNNGESPATVHLGANYVEFRDTTYNGNAIRLYICRYNPGNTGIPVGSIGIGW